MPTHAAVEIVSQFINLDLWLTDYEQIAEGCNTRDEYHSSLMILKMLWNNMLLKFLFNCIHSSHEF